MPRYEAPTGQWWEVDVAAETIFDERWGGPGGKPMSRVRHCASAAARDATIAELVAKHMERGFVLAGNPAMRAVAPPPPGRLVRRLERGTEWAQLALDGTRVTHRRGDTANPGEWAVDDDLAREDGAAAFALVEQLTADYVNVQGFAVVGERDPARKKAGAVAPVNAALEAECIAAPDTAAPWAVYADYLMTAGDPRGDIAALAAADRLADAFTRRDAELSWVAFGDFTGAWPRLPALEVLEIRSGEGGVLGDLVLPRLEEFVRESGGLGGGELAAIAAARSRGAVND